MNTDSDLNRMTELVIGCAYRVGNTLGSGFLEKVYENALAVELRKVSIAVDRQHAMKVISSGEIVGEFIADIVADGKLIVEIKAVRRLDQIHAAQCLNYLKATGLRFCLLINFGTPRVEIKRIINGN